MPEFIDWSAARDPIQLRDGALEVLSVGGWVAFPTETGWALAARGDRPETLPRVPAAGLTWSLALPESADPSAWTGELSAVARRLLRRTLPGPVVFEFAAANSGLAAQLPEAVRQRVVTDGFLALRRPAHDAILDVLAGLDVPLVLGEPSRVSGRVPGSPAEWLASLGESIDLVLEAGPPRFDQPATRVRVVGDDWSVIAPGVYSVDELQRLAACLILFVCTGNTCRSPMAEAIAKALLARRLGCGIAELPSRGFWVTSAGVAAWPGEPAAEEAKRAAAAFGGDLGEHQSRQVWPELAAGADHLIAMTRSHLVALRELFPDLGTEPRLLCGSEDLPDPLGGDQDVYDQCSQLIQGHLEGLVEEVTGP